MMRKLTQSFLGDKFETYCLLQEYYGLFIRENSKDDLTFMLKNGFCFAISIISAVHRKLGSYPKFMRVVEAIEAWDEKIESLNGALYWDEELGKQVTLHNAFENLLARIIFIQIADSDMDYQDEEKAMASLRTFQFDVLKPMGALKVIYRGESLYVSELHQIAGKFSFDFLYSLLKRRSVQKLIHQDKVIMLLSSEDHMMELFYDKAECQWGVGDWASPCDARFSSLAKLCKHILSNEDFQDGVTIDVVKLADRDACITRSLHTVLGGVKPKIARALLKKSKSLREDEYLDTYKRLIRFDSTIEFSQVPSALEKTSVREQLFAAAVIDDESVLKGIPIEFLSSSELVDNSGNSLLMVACENLAYNVAYYILTATSIVHTAFTQNDYHMTALMIAAVNAVNENGYAFVNDLTARLNSALPEHTDHFVHPMIFAKINYMITVDGEPKPFTSIKLSSPTA
jgi:hypothetical protein